MKNLKTLGVLMLSFIMISCAMMNFTRGKAGNLSNKHQDVEYTTSVDGYDLQESGTISEGSKNFSSKIGGILQVPKPEDYNTSLGYAMALIQIAVNRLLGILAFVALIYMIYCGFLIFSSGSGDSSAKKGKKGISTAAIALAGIGLSWLIISAIIWFINTMATK